MLNNGSHTSFVLKESSVTQYHYFKKCIYWLFLIMTRLQAIEHPMNSYLMVCSHKVATLCFMSLLHSSFVKQQAFMDIYSHLSFPCSHAGITSSLLSRVPFVLQLLYMSTHLPYPLSHSRYIPVVRIIRPTTKLLCELYFTQSPYKIK